MPLSGQTVLPQPAVRHRRTHDYGQDPTVQGTVQAADVGVVYGSRQHVDVGSAVDVSAECATSIFGVEVRSVRM